MKKEEIKEILKEGFKCVKFRKVDGTERTLVGTTNRDIISDIQRENNEVFPEKENKKSYTEPEGVIRIYCPDEPGYWRSFKVENLLYIEEYIGEDVGV